jgi:hypothetical protein
MKKNLLYWSYERGRRDFTRIQLPQANLSKMKLTFICFSQANLQGANLSHSQFAGADFVYAQMQQANLSNSNFLGANFLAANLQGVNLSRAMLSGTLLSVTDLSGANLNHATLAGADLRSANLQGANLQGANLQGANLTAANLLDADLTGANLEDAILTGAIGPHGESLDGQISPSNLARKSPQGDKKSLRSQKIKVIHRRSTLRSDFQDVVAYRAEPQIDDPTAKGANLRAEESAWGQALSTPNPQTPALDPDDQPTTGQLRSWGYSFPQGQDEASSRIQRSILLRKGDFDLRQRLLGAYNDRCAISRCGVQQVLEVAYLVPSNAASTQDPSNAILLRSDLHLLFDLHLLAINPDTLTVEIAPWLQDSYYSRLVGLPLYLPLSSSLSPSLQSLAHHRQQCSWEVDSAWTAAYAM